jgi:GGDEF domain-containing protein
VVYCDITGLKRVNDTLGHQAGDQLILRAGELLQ